VGSIPRASEAALQDTRGNTDCSASRLAAARVRSAARRALADHQPRGADAARRAPSRRHRQRHPVRPRAATRTAPQPHQAPPHPPSSVRLHGGLRPVADNGARMLQGRLHHAGIGGGTLPGHARQYGSLRTVDGQLHLVPRPVRPHSGLWLNWRGSAPSMHPLLLAAPPSDL
jgi:hypothetical protein